MSSETVTDEATRHPQSPRGGVPGEAGNAGGLDESRYDSLVETEVEDCVINTANDEVNTT